MKLSLTTFVLSWVVLVSYSFGQQPPPAGYSEQYFKQPQRIAQLKEELPHQLSCIMGGTTASGESMTLFSLTLPLHFDLTQKPAFDIRHTTPHHWFVSTLFPFRKEQKRLINYTFSLTRKDLYHLENNNKTLINNDILLNERIRVTFNMRLDKVWHFERTGLEAVSQWRWNPLNNRFILSIASLEKHSKNATAPRILWGQVTQYGFMKLDKKDAFFFKPYQGRYAWMAQTKEGLREVLEISKNSRCTLGYNK